MQAQGAEERNRLAQLRLSSGLLRSQIAAQLLVSESTVWRWEVGETPIPDERKRQLADLFNVSRAYLMGWEGDPDKAAA